MFFYIYLLLVVILTLYFYTIVYDMYRGDVVEIYIELIYLLHLFNIIICNEMMNILLHCNVPFKEVFIKSLLMSITYFFLFIDSVSYLIFVFWFIIFFLLYKKQVFIFFPIFIIIFQTISYFIASVSQVSFIYNGILIIPMQYSMIAIIIVATLMILSNCMYIIYCKKRIIAKDFMYEVVIVHKKVRFKINAILDSGNNVYYNGFPLIILNKDRINNIEIIDSIFTSGVLVQMIEIGVVDEVVVNGQSLKNVYVGLVDYMEYDGLLNKELMGGII